MSARVESAPVRGSFPGSIVIAIIVALGVGVVAGTLITKAADDRPPVVATTVGSPLWDTQKLDAMQGRELAEQYRSAQPQSWDAQKLEAMAGRVLYQPGPAIEGWDAYKLRAMEGRVLAAQAGAEDPPVKPHLPKRPPSG